MNVRLMICGVFFFMAISSFSDAIMTVDSCCVVSQNGVKAVCEDINKASIDDRLTYMSREGLWVYSLMKCGATYTLNFLRNYFSLLSGQDKPSDYDGLFILHTVRFKLPFYSVEHILQQQEKTLQASGFTSLIHTHTPITSSAKKTILLIRNPLDYIVSYFFYFYRSRGCDETIDDLWEYICSHFIEVYQAHEAILKGAADKDDVISLCYEDIILSPKATFVKLIEFLGVSFDDALVNKAVFYSSKESVKAMEVAKGSVLIAGTSYISKSFIRSGEIGDWKNHIGPELEAKIRAYLSEHGVNLDAFIYE